MIKNLRAKKEEGSSSEAVPILARALLSFVKRTFRQQLLRVARSLGPTFNLREISGPVGAKRKEDFGSPTVAKVPK